MMRFGRKGQVAGGLVSFALLAVTAGCATKPTAAEENMAARIDAAASRSEAAANKAEAAAKSASDAAQRAQAAAAKAEAIFQHRMRK
jgi:sensor c-di-GMP phosphodiesterase-like protein